MNTQIKNLLEIPLNLIEAKNLAAIGHDAETNTLIIKFKSKRETGNIYAYDNFTAEKFAEFSKAANIDEFFTHGIRPRADLFPYRKLN